MRLNRLIVLLIGLILAPGCATDPSVTGAVHTELVSPYRLDSGDRVRVIVFGQPELSNAYVVDQGGVISMPLIGAIEARGRTTAEIEAAVGARLRAGYLRSPDVSVEIDRYRPFFVMGEVGAAGQYSFVPGMTVQQAIAVAGGFTPRAEKNAILVTRSIGGAVGTDLLGLSDPVAPGDTLYVRERLF
ncbi:MAG: polysaccharide biosynthesis/export family protein [Bauldia sp.]